MIRRTRRPGGFVPRAFAAPPAARRATAPPSLAGGLTTMGAELDLGKVSVCDAASFDAAGPLDAGSPFLAFGATIDRDFAPQGALFAPSAAEPSPAAVGAFAREMSLCDEAPTATTAAATEGGRSRRPAWDVAADLAWSALSTTATPTNSDDASAADHGPYTPSAFAAPTGGLPSDPIDDVGETELAGPFAKFSFASPSAASAGRFEDLGATPEDGPEAFTDWLSSSLPDIRAAVKSEEEQPSEPWPAPAEHLRAHRRRHTDPEVWSLAHFSDGDVDSVTDVSSLGDAASQAGDFGWGADADVAAADPDRELAEIESVGGLPTPAPPAEGWSSYANCVQATFGEDILRLPRPEFNAWKKANGVAFTREEQKKFTLVRRAALARRYAAEGRQKKKDGLCFGN